MSTERAGSRPAFVTSPTIRYRPPSGMTSTLVTNRSACRLSSPKVTGRVRSVVWVLIPLRQTTWKVTSVSVAGVRLKTAVPDPSAARAPMNAPVGVTVNPVPCGITWTPDTSFGRGLPIRTVMSAVLPSEKVSGFPTIDAARGVSSTWTGIG